MTELYNVGNPINREERNNLNATFRDIQDQMSEMNINTNMVKGELKDDVQGLQTQINMLVVEGDSSPEAAQARLGYDNHVYSTLKSRLDNEIQDRTKKHWVDVRDFGAIGDFDENTNIGTDNLVAFISAREFARDNDLEIYVPSGNYRIGGELIIYDSLVGEGTLYFDNAQTSHRLRIYPKKPFIPLSPSSLSGLTKGSTTVSGLGGDYTGGTLIIESSEILIRRYLLPNNTPYYKREAFLIASPNGKVLPAVDENYNTSQITNAKILPAEKKLIVNVDIKGYGNSPKTGYLVDLRRSNVLFQGNTISSVTSQPINNIISVNECVNVEFNQVNISGAKNETEGYGVALYNTAFVSFYDCHINDCRHAISGRSMKNTIINGGSYSDNIDSHWGTNLIIRDAIITDRILYAGKDLEISGCTFYSTEFAVSLRYDTPQIDGELIFENNRIESSSTGDLSLISYRTQNYGSFDFVETLKNPTSIVISNNSVIAAPNRNVILLNTTDSNNAIQKHNGFLNVEIDNNTMVNDNKVSVVMMYSPNQLTNTRDCRIRIANQKMMGGKTSDTVNLTIRGVGALEATWKYLIDIENCDNVSVYADQNTFKKLNISRSSVVFVARINVAAIPNTFNYGVLLDNCVLKDTTLTIDNVEWHLLNCIIEGVFTAQTATKNMLKRSSGTYLFSGASGTGIDTSINYMNYLRS